MEGEGRVQSYVGWSDEINSAPSDDLEFWMTRLPVPLKDIPIIHLAIPGAFILLAKLGFFFKFRFNGLI